MHHTSRKASALTHHHETPQGTPAPHRHNSGTPRKPSVQQESAAQMGRHARRACRETPCKPCSVTYCTIPPGCSCILCKDLRPPPRTEHTTSDSGDINSTSRCNALQGMLPTYSNHPCRLMQNALTKRTLASPAAETRCQAKNAAGNTAGACQACTTPRARQVH